MWFNVRDNIRRQYKSTKWILKKESGVLSGAM
jgi:hypothetical protein